MTYREAVAEAARRWGGDGEAHLFNVHLYYVVGPGVFDLMVERDVEPPLSGCGRNWAAAFADFDARVAREGVGA